MRVAQGWLLQLVNSQQCSFNFLLSSRWCTVFQEELLVSSTLPRHLRLRQAEER